jgi:hypothetical protein
MRKLALATAAAAAVLITVPVTSQAGSATLQLTRPDNATDVSAKHRRHYRHYGWDRGHHYGWRKHPRIYFRSYGYRPYYRHYGRYHDDY